MSQLRANRAFNSGSFIVLMCDNGDAQLPEDLL